MKCRSGGTSANTPLLSPGPGHWLSETLGPLAAPALSPTTSQAGGSEAALGGLLPSPLGPSSKGLSLDLPALPETLLPWSPTPPRGSHPDPRLPAKAVSHELPDVPVAGKHIRHMQLVLPAPA